MLLNITQIVNVDKSLRSLKKIVHASDLDLLLSSTGPFTLFAPSDLAFEKLEKGLVESLLEPHNRAKLSDLLSNHIVSGVIQFNKIKDGDIFTTINGKELVAHEKDGRITIDGINVLPSDSKISNGVMHMADTVIQ